MTYPASNRHSRTGPSPCATAAPSAAPGGSATLSRRSRCGKSACSNAPRGPKFARSCTSVSQPATSSRTQHCGQGGQSAADRLSAVGRTTRGPHGSPGMGRTPIAHRRRGFCPHGHGALLPRQHLRCAGVRGAERTSKEHRSDQPRANQETRVEEPVVSLRSVPIRATGPIDPFPLPMLCRRPYRRGSRSRSLAAGKR